LIVDDVTPATQLEVAAFQKLLFEFRTRIAVYILHLLHVLDLQWAAIYS